MIFEVGTLYIFFIDVLQGKAMYSHIPYLMNLLISTCLALKTYNIIAIA